MVRDMEPKEVEDLAAILVVAREEIVSSVVDLDIGRSSAMQLPTRMEARLRILANHRRESTRYLTRMVQEVRLNFHRVFGLA